MKIKVIKVVYGFILIVLMLLFAVLFSCTAEADAKTKGRAFMCPPGTVVEVLPTGWVQIPDTLGCEWTGKRAGTARQVEHEFDPETDAAKFWSWFFENCMDADKIRPGGCYPWVGK